MAALGIGRLPLGIEDAGCQSEVVSDVTPARTEK
jgi:hypothetical protein